MQVTVSLDSCPAGSVLTLLDEKNNLVKRIELTSNTVSFTLRCGRSFRRRSCTRGALPLCYKAPGFQYEEQGLRVA